MTTGSDARERNHHGGTRHQYALLTVALMLLAGCATPYQPQGSSGGFTETKLAPDVVKVSFTGNRYTSSERPKDFALLRAAELALEGGYSFIVVLKENDLIDNSSSFTNERTLTTTGNVSTPDGGHTHYHANALYTPGQTGDDSGYDASQAHYHDIVTSTYTPGETIKVLKPTSVISVRFLKEKSASLRSLDATLLASSIRAKYKIEPSAGQ